MQSATFDLISLLHDGRATVIRGIRQIIRCETGYAYR